MSRRPTAKNVPVHQPRKRRAFEFSLLFSVPRRRLPDRGLTSSCARCLRAAVLEGGLPQPRRTLAAYAIG